MHRIALLLLASLPLLAQDVLFRGQPTADELTAFAKDGVATVINLRTPEEMAKLGLDEKRIVEEAGMKYVSVPFPGATPPSDEALAPVMKLLAEAAPGRRVVLHCASSNRVGYVWGVYQFQKRGVPAAQAVEDARQAGMKAASLEQHLRDRLK